jgi:hypothetical protein
LKKNEDGTFGCSSVLLFLHLAALETALTSKSSGSSDDR